MRAFFFGAGSSYGTLKDHPACPPLSEYFGVFLSKQKGFPEGYPNLSMAARHLGEDLSEIGLEDLWTCLDYYAKLSDDGALGEPPRWLKPAIYELRTRALLWLYGRRCDRAAEALPLSDQYTLGKLLLNSEIRNGDVIISFNYDTVVERLAKRFGLSLRHCSGAPGDFVKFVKPHGSASWPLHALPTELIDGKPPLDSLAEDFNNDPLVLGAVPIKSELIREVQLQHGAYNVFRVIMHQWRGVVEAVRDAERLVVVGYSFPKEDQYGRFLFQEGMRLRGPEPIRIENYNTTESGTSILEVFGREGTEIDCRGLASAAPRHHL